LVGIVEASVFGGLLLLAGVVLAFWATPFSGGISLALAGSILFYDSVAKKVAGLGPLVMGLCRSLNLWMGISLLSPEFPWSYLWVPLVYIFAITTISRSEVEGGGRPQLILAVILYAIVIFGVGILVGIDTGHLWQFIPFALIFALMVFRPLAGALREPSPGRIRGAVKAGVLGIVALDAAWAAAYADWVLGLVVLALLPVSVGLAKRFAVT
jgi:4-hydroxybenzoate polyprenyltransferase